MLSSGKTARSTPRASAWRARAIVSSTLKSTSPAEARGLAAAARTKPWRWIAAKGGPVSFTFACGFFAILQHLRHHLDRDFERRDPHRAATDRAEMLLPMRTYTPGARA